MDDCGIHSMHSAPLFIKKWDNIFTLPNRRGVASSRAFYPWKMLLDDTPDAILLSLGVCGIVLTAHLLRHLLEQHSTAYRSLSVYTQYELIQRALNSLYQASLGFFHAHILLSPRLYAHDILYGYTPWAHRVYILTCSTYLSDSLLLVLAPRIPGRNYRTNAWLIHHLLSIFLLIYAAFIRRTSAPAISLFLISAIAHIISDVRFSLRALEVLNASVHTCLQIVLIFVLMFTSVLPPPYLIWKAASSRNVTIANFTMHHMRPLCWAVFLLFYIPHIHITINQLCILRKNWKLRARPLEDVKTISAAKKQQ